MADYYCTRTQITDLLPSLTGSQLATNAQVDAKLRTPAKAWIDSLYAGVSPFPPLPDSNPTDWLVNQADHTAGDETVTIDGGTTDPVAGDIFWVDGHNNWYKVVSYATNVITYVKMEHFASGVEDFTWGAEADFLDNTKLLFNTPVILQQAAAWFGVHIAYQILRNNPEDESAMAALNLAKELLKVDDFGRARVDPLPWNRNAHDIEPGDRILNTGNVRLVRC